MGIKENINRESGIDFCGIKPEFQTEDPRNKLLPSPGTVWGSHRAVRIDDLIEPLGRVVIPNGGAAENG
jgi:hypothetical protein